MPVVMAQFDPAIFQAALLEVAEASKAAAQAAQAAQQATASASVAAAVQPSPASSPSSSGQQNVDWSKLLSKPPVFEYKSTEEEIRAYRDWSWQLIQYLNAIDEGFEKELKQLMEKPEVSLDLTTASHDTRQRSAKLYGLLASLVRNKSLNTIRSVEPGPGYEALRQMTLSLRPSSNNRGLALLSALTSWPAFTMNSPLQPQVLRLEEAMEEARRAGTKVEDQLKQAVLLKAVSGQLRTHLNMAVQDSTTYKELREHVLKWDKSQQRWSGLLFADDTGDAMDISRMEEKGGKKGKGKKGKGYEQKGQYKGKPGVKGKFKGKSSLTRKARSQTARANLVGSKMIDPREKVANQASMKPELAMFVAKRGT